MGDQRALWGEAEKGLPGRLPGGGESFGSSYSKLKRFKQQVDFNQLR